ncbi:DUF6463 family protein [Nocardia sp. IFM 10818]
MDSKTAFPLTGSLLVFIGSVHTALGGVMCVSGDAADELSFWFTAFGVAAVCFGVAVIETERARGFAPVPVLVAIAVLTGFGLVFEPVSGFLTVLVPLGVGVRRWLRHRRDVPVPVG